MQFIDSYYYEYQMAPSPFASFLSLLLGVAGIVACWLLFKKAGKPGWASIVPFYNVYTIFEITWGSGWRFLMLLIPIYNIVLGIQTCIKLAKAFGKSGGFAVGLIFLPSVFTMILGFDSSVYLGVPGKGGYQQSAPNQDYVSRQDYAPRQDTGFRPTFCPSCGAKLENDGSKFCQNCGRPL